MQAHAHAERPTDDGFDAPEHGASAPVGRTDAGSVDTGAVAPSRPDMRPLAILGLSADGDRIVVGEARLADDDPTTDGPAARVSGAGIARQTFSIVIDDRLRAAVRGSLGRFVDSEREIEMAPQLRPREIQSRIRAGASLEQVAAAAGCPVERIEGYAYPVLLERATIAERGRAAQPLDGDARTLEEIALAVLTDRGQQQSAQWDAFKDERGWTVTLTWQAGRSENRAEWAYVPRTVGSSVTPRNSAAAELVEPGYGAPRAAAVSGYDVILGQQPAQRAGADGDRSAAHTAPPAERRNHSEADTASGARPETSPERESAGAASGAHTNPQGEQPAPRGGTKRGHRPPMPSWEDVLLGTRTAEH